MAQSGYPETSCLRQVTGVGVVTSLSFVLALEDPHRFRNSRCVGAYLGLRPRQHQSGDTDRQMGITKAGVYYNLGYIHVQLSEPKKARGMFQRGLELEPDNEHIRQALGAL